MPAQGMKKVWRPMISMQGAILVAGLNAMSLLEDDHWLLALVLTPIVGLGTFGALSLFVGWGRPLADWSNATVRGVRRGLNTLEVARRTKIFSEARDLAVRHLKAADLPVVLSNQALSRGRGRVASFVQRHERLKVHLLFITGLGGMVLGRWVGSNLEGSLLAQYAAGGAVWLGPFGLAIWWNIARDTLATDTMNAAAGAVGRALRAAGEDGAWNLELARGVLCTFKSSSEASLLWVSVSCRSLPFDLVGTSLDRLGDEVTDLDVGDPVFDRASLLTPHGRRRDLCTGWLSPPLRAVLLWFLSEGGAVKDGRLEAEMDLQRADAWSRLEAVLVAMGGVRALMSARPKKMYARAAQVLKRAASDSERAALLDECGRLAQREMATRVWQSWVRDGAGETRVAAAVWLGSKAGSALKTILEAEGERVAVRALAMLAALEHAPTMACRQLTRWVELGAETALVTTAERITGARSEALQRAVARALETAPSDQIAASVVALVVAMGPEAVAVLTPSRLAKWVDGQAHSVEARRALALLMDAAPSDIAAAARRAHVRLEAETEGRIGGLSVVAQDAGGGLALAE